MRRRRVGARVLALTGGRRVWLLLPAARAAGFRDLFSCLGAVPAPSQPLPLHPNNDFLHLLTQSLIPVAYICSSTSTYTALRICRSPHVIHLPVRATSLAIPSPNFLIINSHFHATYQRIATEFRLLADVQNQPT